MTAQTIVFIVIAAAILASAIRVVTTQNVVHAALYLVLTLGGVAALFLLLTAEFIAWVQVLIYVGAIVVLFLFGLMLTKAPIGRQDLDNRARPWAAAAGLLFFVVLAIALSSYYKPSSKIEFGGEIVNMTGVGNELMYRWVVPFEAVSLVLLAALIGSLVLARKD